MLFPTLQKCLKRPTRAAPLVLAGLMTVITPFGPVLKPKLPTRTLPPEQLNPMRLNPTPVLASLLGRILAGLPTLLLLSILKTSLVDMTAVRTAPVRPVNRATGRANRPMHRKNVRMLLSVTAPRVMVTLLVTVMKIQLTPPTRPTNGTTSLETNRVP